MVYKRDKVGRILKGSPTWNKGIPMTKEQKKKLSKINNGRKHTEETKRKISITSRRFWNDKSNKDIIKNRNRKISERFKGKSLIERYGEEESKKFRERLSSKGKKPSKETREKLSNSLKLAYKEGRKKIVKNLVHNQLHSEEAKKKMSASKQGIDLKDWNKFISFEPYDKNFNIRFKNLIRKRDNQLCMCCGKHREKIRRALCVHHINYDKKLTIPQNCISSCDTCHLITQTNRKYWTDFFQSLLSERYGYEYSEGNAIIDISKSISI